MNLNGGKRPGAGRPKGVPNRATRELKALAADYTEEAVKALVRVMRSKSSSDTAVCTAAGTILAYGHGKPRQAVEHTGAAGGPVEIKVIRTIVRPSGA